MSVQRKNSRKKVKKPTTARYVHKSKKAHNNKRKKEILVIIALTVIVLAIGVTKEYMRYQHIELRKVSGSDQKYEVSEAVLKYEPLIYQYAEEYNLEGYEKVIEAMMQQESSGLGTDPMQCSECIYNTEYSQKPGSIEDPEYSIRTGIRYFADCIELAGCQSPKDIHHLKLALQGYNYGHNYISWAIKRDGGYTEKSAVTFSELMKKEYGWDVYGDPDYIEHVLRYYNN